MRWRCQQGPSKKARVALVQPHEPGATTVPARKFFDICRGLPEGAEIAVQLEGERMLVRSGRSRFSLSTLPAADFPNLDDWQSEVEFTLPQATMKRLIEATQFSMAHQDVRYYLNGMLFETEGEELRTVATDGHRLAVCSMPIGQSLPSHSVIVPRKGVIELMRMLDGGDNPLRVQIGSNNIRAHVGDFIFTSKLVDGRFPDYHVLGKREVAAVDHCTAHTCVDFTANIIQRFVVVEMQRQWHVVGCGIGAAQGVDLFQRDMFKGPRRSGEDHRRSHFTAHFEDRLDRLGVMNVKSRHRVAIGLGVL